MFSCDSSIGSILILQDTVLFLLLRDPFFLVIPNTLLLNPFLKYCLALLDLVKIAKTEPEVKCQ